MGVAGGWGEWVWQVGGINGCGRWVNGSLALLSDLLCVTLTLPFSDGSVLTSPYLAIHSSRSFLRKK